MAKQPSKVIAKKEPTSFVGGFAQRFKEKNIPPETTTQKQQKWLVLIGEAQKALEESINIPGLPLFEITTILGHSNTGKSTFVLEAIKACQHQGLIAVYFDLETSVKWNHAKSVGVSGVREVVDEETGEIHLMEPEDVIHITPKVLYDMYKNFNHEAGKYETSTQRDTYCIADVSLCIRDMLKQQKEENIKESFYFIIDSIGSGESYRSAAGSKINNMWYAGEFSTSFDSIGSNLIPSSKYTDCPWDNGMLIINKVSVQQPAFPGGVKTASAKGSSYAGDYIRRFAIFLGNQTSAGAKADDIIYQGYNYECCRTVKIQLIKNHITGITREGKIVTTSTGLIPVSSVKTYKEDFKKRMIEYLKKEKNQDVNINDLKEEQRDVQD